MLPREQDMLQNQCSTHFSLLLVVKKIDKQDKQTAYRQEHADPEHNAAKHAVSPVINAAPPHS